MRNGKCQVQNFMIPRDFMVVLNLKGMDVTVIIYDALSKLVDNFKQVSNLSPKFLPRLTNVRLPDRVTKF